MPQALTHRATRDDLRRVVRMLEHARRYYYRRVEKVSFLHRHICQVNVTLFLEIPESDDDTSANAADQRDELPIIAAGLFPKVRLPDLTITDERGQFISPLRNDEITAILATLLLDRAQAHVSKYARCLWLSGDQSCMERIDRIEQIWAAVSEDLFLTLIMRVLELGREDAIPEYRRIQESIKLLTSSSDPDEWMLGQILTGATELWDSVLALCGSIPVLVQYDYGDNPAQKLHRLEITYTKSWLVGFRSPQLRLDRRDEPSVSVVEFLIIKFLAAAHARDEQRKPKANTDWLADMLLGSAVVLSHVLQRWVVRLMSSVGVIGTPLRQRTPNADHSKSYYIMFDIPADVSCTRVYWTSAEKRLPPHEAVEVVSGYRTLSAEHLPDEIRFGSNEMIAELQLARTGTVFALTGGALLLAVVCAYFYRNPIYNAGHYVPSDGIRQVAAAIGALLVAAPAGFVAYLTTSLSDLGAYLTRGIRLMCAIGAIVAVWAGFSIAVLMPEDHGLYNMSLLLASTANFVAGATAVASLGPRSRSDGRLTKSRIGRSQQKLVSLGGDPASQIPVRIRRSGVPADTRYRQRRHAFLGAIGCALFTDAWVAMLRIRGSFQSLGRDHWWEPFRAVWERTGTHWLGYSVAEWLRSLSPGRDGAFDRLLVALGFLALGLAIAVVSLATVGSVARARLLREDQAGA